MLRVACLPECGLAPPPCQLPGNYWIANCFDMTCLDPDALIPTPVITTLAPNTAAAGDPDFVMIVNGTDFTPNTRIIWNNASLEDTVFISPTQVSTIVRTSLSTVAIDIPVRVETEGKLSNEATFAITDPTP